MTNPATSQEESSKATRLDPPHDLLSSSDGAGDETSDPWMAYAGRDPERTSQQVGRQANELLAYVKDQNRDIDERQAELNAKLAQLDNQLRNARLRSVDDTGADLLSVGPKDNSKSPSGNQVDNSAVAYDNKASDSTEDQASDTSSFPSPESDELAPSRQAASSGSHDDEQFTMGRMGYAQELVSERVSRFVGGHKRHAEKQEFEEVDQIVAQFGTGAVLPEQGPQHDSSGSDTNGDSNRPIADLWNHDPGQIWLDSNSQDAKVNSMSNSVAPMGTKVTENRVDAFPDLLASSHLRSLDRFESAQDPLALEKQRLADKELELERRKTLLDKLEEESRALHREALEMRIATEELWSNISDSISPEQLKKKLLELRSRLDADYRKEKDMLVARTEELASLQLEIDQKEAAFREQSTRMQEWFTTRENEIRLLANEVEAKNLLVERREQRLQDEIATWEAQRKTYDSQLQGLAKKLQLHEIRG